jgi:hypothetical protein
LFFSQQVGFGSEFIGHNFYPFFGSEKIFGSLQF